MSTKRELGRAFPEQAHVLPELNFDMFEGQRTPATFGKTTTPVNVLPELAVDMSPEASGTVPVVIQGRVLNGVVVPEGGPALPEGAAVSIHFTPPG